MNSKKKRVTIIKRQSAMKKSDNTVHRLTVTPQNLGLKREISSFSTQVKRSPASKRMTYGSKKIKSNFELSTNMIDLSPELSKLNENDESVSHVSSDNSFTGYAKRIMINSTKSIKEFELNDGSSYLPSMPSIRKSNL